MLKLSVKNLVVGLALCLAVLGYAGNAVAAPAVETGAGASAKPNCPEGQAFSPNSGGCAPAKESGQCSAGVDPKDPTRCVDPNCTSNNAQECLKKNPIVKNLNTIITALSAAVGLLVIGVIIVGGIQYTLAGDNASATSAAKQRIINGLIALVAYIFLFGFLQWLTPGGI